MHSLAGPGQDIVEALERLGDRLGAEGSGIHQAAQRPDPPTGDLTAETLALAVGALLPEGAIVVDEANTAGVLVPAHTAGAPPHDVLALTGGAIGQGLPVGAGAAVACPDQRRLLRSYGTWRVLRRARLRATTAPRPRTPTFPPWSTPARCPPQPRASARADRVG